MIIASFLCSRSPFLKPFDKREEADRARQRFSYGKSDLLTYVNAFKQFSHARKQVSCV
jgi:ATP-dependent RNA helicase DHX57